MKNCRTNFDFKKLETFLFIFIFGWLGRKCATRGERQRKKRLMEAIEALSQGKAAYTMELSLAI